MISVIIPVYNVEKYLEDCLKSVVEQDYVNIQIICVDDGSTDSSLDILNRYAEKYRNIEVFTKDNGGLSSARNYGLVKAKGEYVYFLDSDDKLADNKCISFIVNRMVDNELDVLCFDGETFFESELMEKNNNNYNNYYDRIKSYGRYEKGFALFKELFKDGHYRENMALKCIKRELIINNHLHFMEGMIYEDAFFSFALVLFSRRVEHVNRKVYLRRVRCGSITQSPIMFYNVYSMFRGYLGILDLIRQEHLDNDDCVKKYICSLCDYTIELYNQISDDERKKVDNLDFYESHILHAIIPKGNLEYVFPYHLFTQHARVILYGAGKIGKLFFSIGKKDTYVNIVGIADKRASEISRNSFTVIDIKQLHSIDFDFVLICVEKKETALEILEDLLESGIDQKKIKWDGLIYRWDNYIKKKRFLDYVISNINNEKKYIYLLMLPEHGNLGDYLIGYAVQKFLKDFFSEYEVINVTTVEWTITSKELKSIIRKNDILVFTGGGFIGDVWESGSVLNEIIEAFPYNKKFLMPNTLTYKIYNNIQINADLKNILKDNNTYICFRDEMSYDRCNEFGWSNYCIYVPDMALYMRIYRHKCKNKVNRVLLCLRDDIEKDFKCVDSLKNGLLSRRIMYDEYSICRGTSISQEEGYRELSDVYKHIAKYKLVITDRLHVMLICYLLKVPCIAFDNLTHKVSEVYKWIDNSGVMLLSDIDMDSVESVFIHGRTIKTVSFDYEFKKLSNFIRNNID